MTLKLLTEHHLEFLSLKGGCTGSSESTLDKMVQTKKMVDILNAGPGNKLGATRAKYFFLWRLVFICHHTNASSGDNLQPLHHISPFI